MTPACQPVSHRAGHVGKLVALQKFTMHAPSRVSPSEKSRRSVSFSRQINHRARRTILPGELSSEMPPPLVIRIPRAILVNVLLEIITGPLQISGDPLNIEPAGLFSLLLLPFSEIEEGLGTKGS